MTTDDLRAVFWAKALENLASAEAEYVNGRYNVCATRCYYSAFHAAIVALLDAGLPARTGTWGHDYVQAQFVGELINHRKVYSGDFRDTFRVLMELRHKADYGRALVSQREAGRAVRRAEALVGAITQRRGGVRS
jgi:uncharacterized protein (UPF0332 family)